ncbi:MAG: hypothetical protein Kow002_14060 [Anaerolineales bacterium]
MIKNISKPAVLWPLLAISLLVILGCVSPFYVSPSVPEQPAEPLETIIVKTADAAFTQTAMFISPTPTLTYTPVPTKTPTITPSPTPTFVFATWTPIPSATLPGGSTGKDYSCSVLSVSPSGRMAPRTDFDAKWVVQNTGEKTWDRNDADYYYSDGTRMHKKGAYDFPETVQPGETVTLTVDMISPKNTGDFKAVWRIRVGKNQFCNMTITIRVR